MLERMQQLYDLMLDRGPVGTERFYAALQERTIAPTPVPELHQHNLYAPNPALVPGAVVQAMTADANRFCVALRQRTPDAASLLWRLPPLLRDHYVSAGLIERLLADLRREHPLVCLDAFLVQADDGLAPAYLEWQTVGTYATMGCLMMEAALQAWPEIGEYSTLTAWPDLSLDQLRAQLRRLYTRGIEDDPRQGVVVDYRPELCSTRREFSAIQDLTGGASAGMGILDPREVLFRAGQPYYVRDGLAIPIKRVYSRLVYSDLVRLEQEASDEQRASVRRLFQDDTLTWISHPVHFFYGSKADFPLFHEQQLSPYLPESRLVTPALINAMRAQYGAGALEGFVQKPIDGQSGLNVQLNPSADQLNLGSVLQRQIYPLAYHQTLFGLRTPEVRIMAIPDDSGNLITALVYNRIKAADEFLSNAGYLAQRNVPGTGEGFGIVLY